MYAVKPKLCSSELLFFSEAVRIEHLKHVAYYEERRPGLGARYLAAFEAAIVKVCESLERYRIELAPGIRCCPVLGFPYNVLYRQSGSDIEVLVVALHRRRPGFWLGRL